MRIAYLDEAGISNPQHEPYLVVAGVILHADEHWKPLEEHFRALARRYLPDIDQPVFHAKDIFHGSGPFDRKVWSRERREHLLAELCEIPGKFQLPVVTGFHHRQRHAEAIKKQAPDLSKSQVTLLTHADTFVKTALAIEGWMQRATQNESVMLIAEDNPAAKKALKSIHAGYTNRFQKLGKDGKTFHSSHIVETIHFAAKPDSMPLQIADACAFVIKRHMMDRDDIAEHFDLLRPHIVWFEDKVGVLGASYYQNEIQLLARSRNAA